jgi:hypothetical protein
VGLFEKATIPRYKPCGGALVRRAVPSLPFPIDDVLEKACFAAEANLMDAGLSFRATREKPIPSPATWLPTRPVRIGT